MHLLNRTNVAAAAIAIAALGAGCGSSGSDAGGGDLPGQITTSAEFPGITCEQTKIAMRDGVKLNTVIYKPSAATGKLPVLLTRNPYGRVFMPTNCFAGLTATQAQPFANNGYAVVFQDVRGTYLSDGKLGLMTQEADDGYDAVEWAGTRSWSTGKVGMFGGSYLGFTQWQAAIKTPPHLVAMAPDITGSDYHDNWTYVNGVFSLWFNISWPAGAFEGDQIIRSGQSAGATQGQIDASVAAWTAGLAEMPVWAQTLPLTNVAQLKAHQPYFYDWLAHPSYDDYWKKMDVEANYANVKVPALISGATYDIFNVGTVRNFQGMRKSGGSAEAKSLTKLVWQAYGHSGNTKTPDFGSDVHPDTQIALRFFDYHVKGVKNGADLEPNVRAFVLVPPDRGTQGSGFWVTGDSFPLPGTRNVKYFLTSNGNAATRHGNGLLTSDATKLGTADRDTFTYDPANPVPTVGGNLCCVDGPPKGAQEQAAVEVRSDVLVYTSAPLEADLSVVGMVKSSFWAMSSAKDTDFTVKLVDVRPDGQTHNIVDRIVRARYRNGSKSAPVLIEPNVPYQYELELGNAAFVVPKGHQIRIQVSSSNFPLYARNLNTGDDNNTTSAMVVAQQTILHGANRLSYLELPVAPISRPQ